MKTFLKLALLPLALAACAAAASAQSSKLRLDSLDRLEDKATTVVDVSLDEKLMGMAAKFIRKSDSKDPDVSKAADLVAGIHEIYVKSYEFETEGQYTSADADLIRSQVKGSGWDRLVGVRSKKEGENAEVYVLMQGDKMLGLAVIAANPKELTVVNIVGSIDIDRISDLDGDFGIPGIQIKREPKPSSGN